MALILAVEHLGAVAIILLISAAWGNQLLGWLRCREDNPLEAVLFACGLSFTLLEIVVFILSALGWLRFGAALGLLVLMAISAGAGWVLLWNQMRSLSTRLQKSLISPLDRLIAICAAGVLGLEGILAMAPVSGSDAMHYHFTTSLLERGTRLHPIFWLTHSFVTGQAHLLISLGLALGSDRISEGFIYLGGVLSAGTVFAISRRLSNARWAWIAVLVFVASPMVFWQASTSGSPDIWMAFLVGVTALAASRTNPENSERWLILAGFFAGAASAVKYTGLFVPLALLAYILVTRHPIKTAIASGIAMAAGGIGPLARNFIWTGDPVFPFLTRWLTPDRVDSYGLKQLMADTGAGAAHRDLWHVVSFPFAVVLHGDTHGLGQYFGPLILCFAPLLIFARWKDPLARVAAALWGVMFLSNLFTSQMGRFLLSVFPLALGLTFSGVASFRSDATPGKRWKIAAACCCVAITFFIVFALVSDAIYARDFLPAALGIEKEAAFLERMAPDYQTAEFINQSLPGNSGPENGGNVMVFFRHLYYIRVPFVEGDPENSWEMDPAKVSDPGELLALLDRENVRWVVKVADYPPEVRSAFFALEEAGKLVPVASTEIFNLTGKSRIYQLRTSSHVVLLKVVKGP